MEETLRHIGLAEKEVEIYLLLLKQPKMTAQELSESTAITRTNVYRLLDRLVDMKLVTADDSPVKRFTLTEPQALHKLLQEKQAELKRTAVSLGSIMPAIRSQYSLSLDKPGVLYMTGEDGLERLLCDMANSATDVHLIAGDAPTDEKIRKSFTDLIEQRKKNGVQTYALYHDGPHRDAVARLFDERGFKTRFIGEQPFDSEIILYEDNTVFTTYDPEIIITVITNSRFTATMRTIFMQMWGNGHEISCIDE